MKSTYILASISIALAVGPSCSEPLPSRRPLTQNEIALRNALGVPLDAPRVMVFGQNAHLDIDWQKSFDDYYSSYVEQIYLQADQLLTEQPRAFYATAEMAFLQHHLEIHPEEFAPLKAASDRGAFRIVGGGMTSPDTILPEPELLFRDYLYGLQFAETLDAHPTAAWLPDSFGHSATAPDLLTAAGYESVAFSRIDGAPTLFEKVFNSAVLPKPGSTAEFLQNVGSSDFEWQGAGGATILAHYISGTGLYCEGDNIDYSEGLQVPGGHIGSYQGDDPKFTDGQIEKYIAENQPYAKTPYMFVPVGCDFQSPKMDLIRYLDGYNTRNYAKSGVWVVAAPFEDYAKFISNWRDVLPTVNNELTPYFMGFYGSRADVKRQVRDAARPFFVAEAFATLLGDSGKAMTLAAAPELQKLTRANHHDFVTGTSADAVVSGEQLPLLVETEAAGASELSQVASAIAARVPLAPGATSRILALNGSSREQSSAVEFQFPISAGVAPSLSATANGQPLDLELAAQPAPTDTTATYRVAVGALPPWGYRAIDLQDGAMPAPSSQVTLQLLDINEQPATGDAVARVILANADVHAEWERVSGIFTLASLTIEGDEAIASSSMIVNDYADQGGLWRLGNEMAGCTLTPVAPPTETETIQVLSAGNLAVRVAFVSSSGTREASLAAGDTGLSLAITTGAAQATTRTVSFSIASPANAELHTSSPAGAVTRPIQRVYDPTFFPAEGWAALGGWAVLLRQSTGVRWGADGTLELMATRNAQGEQCDVEGGTGTDNGTHRIEWRIEHVTSDADAESRAQAFDRPIDLELVPTTQASVTDLPFELSLASVTGDGVISAIKPAERGNGVILRTFLLPGPVTVQLSPNLSNKNPTVVDVAERDRSALGTASNSIVFDKGTYGGSIASVRLQ